LTKNYIWRDWQYGFCKMQRHIPKKKNILWKLTIQNGEAILHNLQGLKEEKIKRIYLPEIVDSYTTARRVYVQFTVYVPVNHPNKKKKI